MRFFKEKGDVLKTEIFDPHKGYIPDKNIKFSHDDLNIIEQFVSQLNRRSKTPSENKDDIPAILDKVQAFLREARENTKDNDKKNQIDKIYSQIPRIYSRVVKELNKQPGVSNNEPAHDSPGLKK